MYLLETKVKETGDAVVINKGAASTLISIHDDTCMIVSLTFENRDGVPHIPYVYKGLSFTEAYDKYLQLIGKMCVTIENSKYFSLPAWEDHCRNGVLRGISQDEWEHLALDAVAKVKV